MPIIGLTTRKNALPPFIGKLHKGSEGKPGKTKNGKDFIGYGDDLDHFRFTPYKYNPKENRAMSEAEAQLAHDFTLAYPKTQRLEVYFSSDDVDIVWEAYCEEWDASQLVHRCDGVNIYERDKTTGELEKTDRHCPYHGKETKGCKQVGRLNVILPELLDYGYAGTITIETHGKNDIPHIQSVLDSFKTQHGHLMGVPFFVWRQFERVSVPDGNGGRRRQDKWLIKMQSSTDYIKARLEQSRQRTLEGGSRIALPMPVFDRETGEIYEGESTTIEMATADQWESINALGKATWLGSWHVIAPKTIRRITGGRGDKPRDLTYDEAVKMFDEMEEESVEIAEATAKAEAPTLDPAEMPI